MKTLRPVVLLLLFLLAAPAAAEDQGRKLARTLVQEAMTAYEGKDFDKALQLLLAAYRLFPSDKIQYSLGRVHEARREWDQALRAYRRYLALPPAERLPQQTEDAEVALRRLQQTLGQLQVTGVAGTWYQIDGGARLYVPAEPSLLAPGSHRIATEGGGDTVVLRAGATLLYDLGRIRQPAAPAPKFAARQLLRPGKWAVGAGGLALLVTGIGVWAVDGKPTCDLMPGQVRCPERLNTDAGGATLFTLGAVALGGAALMFWLDRPRPARGQERRER